MEELLPYLVGVPILTDLTFAIFTSLNKLIIILSEIGIATRNLLSKMLLPTVLNTCLTSEKTKTRINFRLSGM